MPKFTLYYTIHNGGDGSASVQFHDSGVAAQMVLLMDERTGKQSFADTFVLKKELQFGDNGVLSNPTKDFKKLSRDFKSATGKKAPRNAQLADKPKDGFTVFYTIHNGGDGSASVQFHDSAVAAQMATEIEEARGEAFCETNPRKVALSFDANGILLKPKTSFAELSQEFERVVGKKAPANPLEAAKPVANPPKHKKPRP